MFVTIIEIPRRHVKQVMTDNEWTDRQTDGRTDNPKR